VPRRLIVNADDYGRTPEISRGIREAHLQGVVTSTTCMMNLSNTGDDISVALNETPNLGLGVHLVLTMGSPLSAPESIPSIVDERGNFLKYNPLIEHLSRLKIDEVKREWRAQIECFLRFAKKKPTHLDSHHHSSYFSPELFRAMLELAQEYGCAIRFPFTRISRELEATAKHTSAFIQEFKPPHPDVFFVGFYDENATQEHLLNILHQVGEGGSELMCHPGHVDSAFAEESVYNFQRAREFEILTDPAIKDAIEKRGIQLITFADL
jgi:chitin disaccharide deacetylase